MFSDEDVQIMLNRTKCINEMIDKKLSYFPEGNINMADFLIVNQETGMIDNIIVIEDPEMVKYFGGISYYTGARIGDYYLPPEIKDGKIAETKTALASFLSKNPIKWKDGKYYSVTQEKQSQLTSIIATYQIEVQSNPSATITWNSTGEECVEWDIKELCALAVAIKNYVKPMVTYQQEKEIEIRNCKSVAEVDAVEIDYSTVAVQPIFEVPSDKSTDESTGSGSTDTASEVVGA